jgi:putative tricarboxylic transport membrane protein
MVLALILGPLLEQNFRRWLSLADGQYVATLLDAYTHNPVSIVLSLLVVATIVLPMLRRNGTAIPKKP